MVSQIFLMVTNFWAFLGVYQIPVIIVAAMWLIAIANAISRDQINKFGIVPRTKTGLIGLISHTILHGNFSHMAANTIPFVLLSSLVLTVLGLNGYIYFLFVCGFVEGVFVWVIGRNSNHIGASGVIFSMLGFLLYNAIRSGSTEGIATGVIAFFLYGGAVAGIIPNKEEVSWEGHLGGLLTGIAFVHWNWIRGLELIFP